ncbi:hypothetical protein GCM10017581_080000 [Dactylosporangium matsuzakiense]|uniref:Uncharacterized protein n=1 Tax=Dactylosporangium matsuzakiense TaxID=53360 RepID=A0A9W6NRK9_9ACTN|nr:hypothetical protein GCM10017581_080000 [Dactylosporangium matsuzakiense]
MQRVQRTGYRMRSNTRAMRTGPENAYGCRGRHPDTRTRGKLLEGSRLCIEGYRQRVNNRGDAQHLVDHFAGHPCTTK